MRTLLAAASASAQSKSPNRSNLFLTGNCPNFHKIMRSDPAWVDITHGMDAFNIAANPASNAVWITFQKADASGNGYHIGKYNQQNKLWEETPDQPVGADYSFDSLAVDNDGDPAYIGFKSKHILFMKQGMWTEVGGCSAGVAYGPRGVLHRRGCEGYVYRYVEEEA